MMMCLLLPAGCVVSFLSPAKCEAINNIKYRPLCTEYVYESYCKTRIFRAYSIFHFSSIDYFVTTVKLEMFAHDLIREFRGWCKTAKLNSQQTLIANDK